MGAEQLNPNVRDMGVYNGPYQSPGYVPPQPRKGYGMVGSAQQTALPGRPIGGVTAMYMNKLQTDMNNARNNMLVSSQQSQLLDAMNNPETYKLTQMFGLQGIPADQALSMAMNQVTAKNGDLLGLSRTLQPAQAAVDNFNNAALQNAVLAGTEFIASDLNGSYNVPTSGFRYMNPQTGRVVHNNNEYSNVSGDTITGMAAYYKNPTALNQLVTNTGLTAQANMAQAVNKMTYGGGNAGTGTYASTSGAATAAQNAYTADLKRRQKEAENAAKAAKTATTGQPHGAGNQ